MLCLFKKGSNTIVYFIVNVPKFPVSLTLKVSRVLKPGQNKKGQKNVQLHRFLNTFLQLAAEKQYSKNGAAGIFFGPFHFDPALLIDGKTRMTRKKNCLFLKLWR